MIIGKYVTSNSLKSEAIQFAIWKHEKMLAHELELLAEGDEKLWFFNTQPHLPEGKQNWVKYSWSDLYEEFKQQQRI